MKLLATSVAFVPKYATLPATEVDACIPPAIARAVAHAPVNRLKLDHADAALAFFLVLLVLATRALPAFGVPGPPPPRCLRVFLRFPPAVSGVSRATIFRTTFSSTTYNS